MIAHGWLGPLTPQISMRASAGDMEQLDLIICDISMPGLSSYDLIRQMRQQGINVPAIALPALARPEDRQKPLDAGFDRHVAKPVRPTDLLDVIERLLSS
jgi:CheY-like chemotaxis protein